jgi:hypothetical protein
MHRFLHNCSQRQPLQLLPISYHGCRHLALLSSADRILIGTGGLQMVAMGLTAAPCGPLPLATLMGPWRTAWRGGGGQCAWDALGLVGTQSRMHMLNTCPGVS